MNRKFLSQETLKIIACVTMLIDHIGAVFVPAVEYRIIGRLAFPIYCFLLSCGVQHTRHPGRYCLRLLVGALLAELPFDLLFFGRFTWAHQSVMITLLLGVIMLIWGRRTKGYLLPFAVCFFAAEFLRTDYGGWGIALIALFGLTAGLPGAGWMQLAGMAGIFLAMDSYRVSVLGLGIPIQMFGLAAMVPILRYSGKKSTVNRAVQLGFYLFYPVHLALLLLIRYFR